MERHTGYYRITKHGQTIDTWEFSADGLEHPDAEIAYCEYNYLGQEQYGKVYYNDEWHNVPNLAFLVLAGSLLWFQRDMIKQLQSSR